MLLLLKLIVCVCVYYVGENAAKIGDDHGAGDHYEDGGYVLRQGDALAVHKAVKTGCEQPSSRSERIDRNNSRNSRNKRVSILK